MRKFVAAALCLITLLSLFSCNHNNGNITDLSDTEEQPSENESLQNQMALQAYGKAIRNEINVYYPLLLSDIPYETFFEGIGYPEKGIPTAQALIDMDKDGIKELILAYDGFFILLHFENDIVYATDFNFASMETIYTDGSFSWSHTDDIFGYECGISRISFANGIKKVEELCRTEGASKFFIGGVQVTKDKYYDYLDESERTPITFTTFDTDFLDGNELKAIKIASDYWGINDGDFDSERGLRYRVICKRKIDERWYEISLYRFVYNSYYEHLEIATVNIETKEIQVTPYPDGKG